MKPFVRNLLAVILGIAIMWIVGFLIVTGLVTSAVASMDAKPQVPSGSVLVLDMSAIHIAEQSSDVPAGADALLGGSMGQTVGLWDAIDGIITAAYDPGICCLYVKPDGADCGISGLEELRSALTLFRQSGKPVVAYIQNPSNGSMYLGSAADKFFMTSDHGSTSTFVGVAGQMLYLKDLLDRLGVHVQLIRHGQYKSAGEMFIRSSSSPENREQNLAMVRSIWATVSREIAAARVIDPAELDRLVDGLLLNVPEDFLATGLVDGLKDKNAMTDYLCRMADVSDAKDLSLVALGDYLQARTLSDGRSGWKIALIFADGEIVDTPESGSVSGDAWADLIDSVRRDDSVKAVVFRVNSPGGSVLASSKIKDAMEMLCEAKPVIASYGDYAASGGYWISCGCKEIYSDATTLTGSIGVFSMIPDLSATTQDLLHVGVETIGSGPHSDMYSMMRPLDTAELQYLQDSVEDIYERFVALVADGRNLSEDFVDSVAQGRVWTGAEAKEIGLVDKIGTLQDALYRAAFLSGGPEDFLSWQVVQYPAKETMMDVLNSLLGDSAAKPTVRMLLSGTPFEGLSSAFDALTVKDPSRVYARLPYAIDIH